MHTLEGMDAECPGGVPSQRFRKYLLIPGNIQRGYDELFIRTPLRYACFKGWVVMVQWLLENGADPNQDFGRCLCIAAEVWDHSYPSKEIIRLLVRHGAKVNSDGPFTALGGALFAKNYIAVRELVYHGALPSFHGYPDQLENILSGVKKCGVAAITTHLCVRKITRDPNVARLLGYYVWETRVEEEWSQ